MADSVADTRREIDETRAALGGSLDRLEARVHYELDVRARLRRNRTRLLIGGVGLVVVIAVGAAGSLVLRHRRKQSISERLKDMVNFDDLKGEVQRLREDLEARAAGRRQHDEPLWMKVALRSTTAAGAAAGSMLTKSLVDKYDAGDPGTHPGEVAGKAAASV